MMASSVRTEGKNPPHKPTGGECSAYNFSEVLGFLILETHTRDTRGRYVGRKSWQILVFSD
jgi:hypothetical protein